MGCLRGLFSIFKSDGPSERTKRREPDAWGRALETHRRRPGINTSKREACSVTKRFYDELPPQEQLKYGHRVWTGRGKYPPRPQPWQTEEAAVICQQMQAEQIQQAKQARPGPSPAGEDSQGAGPSPPQIQPSHRRNLRSYRTSEDPWEYPPRAGKSGERGHR